MLIEMLKPEFEYGDGRGRLAQLLGSGCRQVNYIFSNTGAARGSHYHGQNREIFYVIRGRFELFVKNGDVEEKYAFADGMMFAIPPGVAHSFHFLQATELIAMYDKGVELGDGQMDIINIAWDDK